jgi:retinol dehydrogenase 12
MSTADADAMRGKICLVSGATRGIGQATALGLARRGATVVIIGRSAERIKNTLALLRQESGSSCIEGIQADLSSVVETRQAAATFLAKYARLDVLINNVGGTFLRYQASPEGYELTWALDYLNHFVLTQQLLDLLKDSAAKSGEARVIEITSSIYRYSPAGFTRLQGQQGYNGVAAYAQAKRAQLVYALQLARQVQRSGVRVNAVTPGFVATGIAGNNGGGANLVMGLIRRFSLPVDEGARPILQLACAAQYKGVSGRYFYRFQEQKPDPSCAKPEHVEQLWRVSTEMAVL